MRNVYYLLLTLTALGTMAVCSIAGPAWSEIESLPDIKAPDPGHEYRLVWWTHRSPNVLFVVRTTNLAVADPMTDAVFEGWCIRFDSAGFKPTGKLLVAANERFQLNYQPWTEKPFDLPHLKTRWFEELDDERWYILELSKLKI